jgi:hypothetical protein
MIKILFNWFCKLFKRQKLYRAKFVNEIPDRFVNNIIYVIQNEGYSWQAVMICPCGCQNILYMNLIKEHKPSWEIEVDKNRSVSLHPSINRIVGCKSHFFLKNSKIKWC